MGKFNYENFKFDYEPYPLGVAREFIEPEFYRRLVESFPPIELFGTFSTPARTKSARRTLSARYLSSFHSRNPGLSGVLQIHQKFPVHSRRA
jgi:hypothetical protein